MLGMKLTPATAAQATSAHVHPLHYPLFNQALATALLADALPLRKPSPHFSHPSLILAVGEGERWS